MKTFKFLSIVLILAFALNINAQEDPGTHQGYKVEGKELADGTLYGNDIDATQPVLKIADIFTNVDSFQNKTVVVEGTLTEVCQSMGCWTVVTDGTNDIRAQTLHKYFLPKDLPSGSKVVIAGEFEIKEITEEQAKHFAEESKNPKVKAEDIKGPQKMYRVKATGIKVLK
jgi:uncharacterized protein YdeI (BOF family)